MKINYRISQIKVSEFFEQFLEFVGGISIFIDSGILIDGALNNLRFKSYRQLFDNFFVKSKNIILETSIINIIEAIKILLNKALIHFIIDEFTHHENELKDILERYQNFINQYYRDIIDSYGKLYIKKLEKFLRDYEINVIEKINITYEIVEDDSLEISYSILEDKELMILFLLYGKKIDYNDFISLAVSSERENDIFITTDNRLAESIRDSRISHIFPSVYSVADKEHVIELLEEFKNWGLIETYEIEDIK